ncbi:MIP/aquaporin family protein [Pseudonocardia xinjiangensis]|uniref:MIP/aquaporin family protein n=1 Tax=Pseudonocardia xinjiangensis TaxID=75289 RepID=UPI003D8C8E58
MVADRHFDQFAPPTYIVLHPDKKDRDMAKTPESTGSLESRAQAPEPAEIARHSALEGLLTCALLFGVTTFVRWVIGPSFVSDAIPQIHVQLLIVGACVGLFLAVLILSRPGKISGGHINPAVSLAMWRFGVFPGAAVVPYILAQLVGSFLGVLAARALWGPVVEEPPVAYCVLQPGADWTAGELFVAEAISMGVIVYVVGLFLQRPKLARLVPWLVGFLIGAAITVLGTTTGGSVNPARQFGPAVISGQLSFLWVYLIAPMVGAAVAAAALNWVPRHRAVLTHRLCGSHPDGSPQEG